MSFLFRLRKGANFDNIETLVSPRARVQGHLRAEGAVRVDGSIEGEVEVKGDLVIGEKGIIQGNIKVENILIGGSVEGNITARGRAEILSSGEVRGDIIAATLVVEEGGLFIGNSRMHREKDAKRETRNKASAEGTQYSKKAQGD